MGISAHQIPSEAAAHGKMVQGAGISKLHENQGLCAGLALDMEWRELLVGVAQRRACGAVLRQRLVQLLGPQAAMIGQQRLLPCTPSQLFTARRHCTELVPHLYTHA